MGNFYASDRFEVHQKIVCTNCGHDMWLVTYNLGERPEAPGGVLPGHEKTEWVHCENPDSDLNYLSRKCL